MHGLALCFEPRPYSCIRSARLCCVVVLPRPWWRVPVLFVLFVLLIQVLLTLCPQLKCLFLLCADFLYLCSVLRGSPLLDRLVICLLFVAGVRGGHGSCLCSCILVRCICSM